MVATPSTFLNLNTNLLQIVRPALVYGCRQCTENLRISALALIAPTFVSNLILIHFGS